MDTSKATEKVNEGATEIKVDTVDYRSPPGADDQRPKKESVQVTHLIPGGEERNVTADTASKVADKIHAVKEKLSGAAGTTTKDN